MRVETIKKFIDKKIIKILDTNSYDEVRDILSENVIKFTNRVDIDIINNIIEIEKIKDVRTKYNMIYILFARKRILDLYKIENCIWSDWDNVKKFKAFLFKEKISGIEFNNI